jgi:type I restriction enzyme R subunit
MNPKEADLEDEITEHLVTRGGYTALKHGTRSSEFDPTTGLDQAALFAFLQDTQPDEWAQLVKLHGADPAIARARFTDRLTQQLGARGTVDVLRHGLVDHGVTVRLAFFKPAHGLTDTLVRRYRANRLTVTRQLPYAGDSTRTVDLCIFLNGIPVATAELKNPLTGQTVEDAIEQYRQDRDPRNLTLARAVVHFAVDPERVAMTTKLEGPATRFMPFNRGHDYGAGNPPNPDGHRTSYLWERVWQGDAWLDILQRFVHVEKDERGRATGIVFPRYHQWDAVLTLEADARANGAGHSYLVQHSAGSGKSNTIAWLAHRLSSLHAEDDVKVFDKVIVITDRLVLDRQLQDTIYQLEHAHGVVQKIDQSSSQLAEALAGEQARVIITTLQKFPFVIEKVGTLPDRRYAVIVDEAHSSQTGEAAKDLKVVLGVGPQEELAAAERAERSEPSSPAEDALLEQVTARGRQPNLSFFAFTATPKGKTLELFGRFDETEKRYVPSHLYSMKQAIEEGFILDVLANYVTYATYYRVAKAVGDDPRYQTARARRAIARYVALHPTQLAQKAEVIIEHFREHVAPRIGGHAKAMVVTGSRLHAVRYKQALDAYIRRQGYGDVKTLVAFSGRVLDRGESWSEVVMNKLPESRTAEVFGTDEYQVMVVAEKFQTGFDQPLLHTMYVDKVLLGLAAVQTLSRLNRIHPDKTDTFVLDFRNEADDIRRAFQQYHGVTVAPPTDPNLLYDTRAALDDYDVLRRDEIERLTALLVASKPSSVSARVYAALEPGADRFRALDPDDQETFRDSLDAFVRTYAFLSQLVSFGDTQLERDYLYCKALASLIRRPTGTALDLGKEVELTHLHNQLTFEGRLEVVGTVGEVAAVYRAGGRLSLPEEEALSRIIQDLNEHHGQNLTEAHRLHLEAMVSDLVSDPEVQQEAAANSLENFQIRFARRFERAIVKEMRRNEEFSLALLNDEAMRERVERGLSPDVYTRARVGWQRECPIGDLLARGEDQYLEFKSSFEWDIRANQPLKVLRTATLKTIAAFLNSAFGGTLVIGVADDGAIVGLEHDYSVIRREGKDDADWFQLHLSDVIEDSMGLAAATCVTTHVHHVDGHDVCRVHVEPSSHPVTAKVLEVDRKGQHRTAYVFYVRLNTGTRAVIDKSEVEKYVARRWGRSDLSRA